MERTHARKPQRGQRSPQHTLEGLRVSEPDDAWEREADRLADAAVGHGGAARASLSHLRVSALQRDEAAAPKTEEEKYKEAAKKLGEAFLETAPGRELKEKAEKLGEAFIATLPGKILTGSAITGAVTALAATHQELPIGIPEIPLDKVSDRLQGWKLKITYEGPVDKPTKVTGTFTVPLGPSKAAAKKPALTESEKFRAETARMAQEQQQFRESLKTPAERAQDQRMMDAWLRSRMGAPGTVPGLSLGMPGRAPGAGTLPPAFELSGEKPKTKEPKEEKKKDDDTAVQRKANGASARAASGAAPTIRESLQSEGHPLDAGTRAFMRQRLGHDFGHVRVHTDASADRAARATDARAYTIGSDVVFAAGEYSPHTADGRRLLAHELVHTLQQEGPASDPAMPLIRRKPAAPITTPEQALKKALDGDDDDTRDLTKSPHWPAVKLTPEETAALLIHLLDGATLDDDEIAGLVILRKAFALGIFDAALGRLAGKGRFKQLLDDYHGAEYRQLLELLSASIAHVGIKAIYLDCFIAMWWVREHEERAIVVLLERTAVNDLVALLLQRNRLRKLRDAIDTAALTIRYETVVGKVNEMRQQDLAAQLTKIFDVKAKASQASGRRTADETNRLLAAAAADLAAELLEYRTRLRDALNVPKPDSKAIAEINKEFETRLGELIERKRAEFDMELKYNVEFNRLMNETTARARSWSAKDLEQIDTILAWIPPEILLANPAFRAITRAESHPERAGQAPWGGGSIKLFGELSHATTAHELGHVISYDDAEKLQKEFNKQFTWEALTLAEMLKLIPDRKSREKLLKQLDDDRAKKRQDVGDRHRFGEHFYRYDRYHDGQYLRHAKDACFVSDYAATDPYDDFADSFAQYLLNPAVLHQRCAGKYTFMRAKVFVGYFLGKQAAKLLDEYDKEANAGLTALNLATGLITEIRTGMLKALRDALEKELEATGTKLEAQALGAKPDPKMKRIPLTGTEARDAAKPYRERLASLLKVLTLVAKTDRAYEADAWVFELGVKGKLAFTAQMFRYRLRKSFSEEILALLTPIATRIIRGEQIVMTTWPEMDALGAKHQRALKLAPAYLKAYEAAEEQEFLATAAAALSITEEREVGPIAWQILRKYPAKDPRRQKLKDFMLKRRVELEEEGQALQKDIVARAVAGVPANKAKLVTPEALVKAYERDIRAFIKREGLTLQRQVDRSGADRAVITPLVEQTLRTPGIPLPNPSRAYMEARFGHDFSRVRIHADGAAAAAASSVGARAFTVGAHVVFAHGARFASPTDRRLLAHELTHVVQQGAAPAFGRGGYGIVPALQRSPQGAADVEGPQIEEEIVDLQIGDEDIASADTQPAPTARTAVRPPIGVTTPTTARGEDTVIPADHPSEAEATRVAEEVASDDRETAPAIGARLAPDVAINRDEAPAPAAPKRRDLAFVMGRDKPKSANRFYTVAKKYFRAHLADVEIIDDPQIKDLAAVFDHLRSRSQPIGTLYLISHAADDGTLSFPLRPGDKDRKVDYRELRDALKSGPDAFKLPAGVIDRSTTIRIKGCRLGQSARMLGTIREAFGAGKVVAPKHRQYYSYQQKAIGRGRHRRVEETTYEGFKTYFIECPGRVKLKRDEQVAAFAAKYSHLPRSDWEKLIPAHRSKVTEKVLPRVALSFGVIDPANDRQVLALAKPQLVHKGFVPVTVTGRSATPEPFPIPIDEGPSRSVGGKRVTYTLEDRHGAKGTYAVVQPADESEIIECAKADESVPEAYAWRLEKQRRGSTLTYTVVGTRTVYSLDRYIVARLGKEPESERLYAPGEESTEFFGSRVADRPPSTPGTKTKKTPGSTP